MSADLFSVVQFFTNGACEYTRRNVPAEEAFTAFRHYCSSVAAKMGLVERVIITDMGDSCCAEWLKGQGLVYPSAEMIAKIVDASKTERGDVK